MNRKIIKICGIRDPYMATQAAMAGADFIGIIFHPSSPRYVSMDQAVAISRAAMDAGASPVAVFVNHTDIEMRYICETTHIKTIQLHGAMARAHHHLLPSAYQRIYIPSVSNNGTIPMDQGLNHLDPHRDFILIDHENPGQGNRINRSGFRYDLPFPWILAGGLSPSTVASAIHDLQPDGVDVSSGVETSRGQKDQFLIQQFILSVRGYDDT